MVADVSYFASRPVELTASANKGEVACCPRRPDGATFWLLSAWPASAGMAGVAP